jgi:hypothetical protein
MIATAMTTVFAAGGSSLIYLPAIACLATGIMIFILAKLVER